MKKVLFITISAALILNSCGTNTGQGAYVGASFGSIIGSAVGGISGGWRGSDIGTLVGMAGGAVVGAAVGAQADKAAAEEYQEHKRRTMERIEQRRQNGGYQSQSDTNAVNNINGSEGDSGFDPSNSGDDRFDFSAGNGSGAYSAELPSSSEGTTDRILEIRNLRFVESDGEDMTIRPGEDCRIVFEVMNRSNRVIYNVQPQVIELTGNKHLQVSQGIIVERIAPGKGIRYTAMVRADSRLKGDTARFRVSVNTAGNPDTAKVQEFNVNIGR